MACLSVSDPGLLAVHVSDRAIVFGIYSGAYLHGYSYLSEITCEALAQMVLAYDQAMSELTSDEQRTVIDITAKRYIEDQTLAAKDAALLNKERKVAQKASEVDAKIEALESDRQALATKITELEVAQRKAETRIKELEAQIQVQVLESANIEAEITRQQLIAQKAELDAIETGVRALEIQAQVADAAYRLASVEARKAELESGIGQLDLETAEVDVKKSQLEADTARLRAQTATEGLVESELEIAKAETIAFKKETTLVTGKGPLLDQRIELANAEATETIPKLELVIADEKSADLASQEAKNQHAVAEYENRKTSYDEKAQTSNSIKDLETSNHAAEKQMIDGHAADTEAYYAAQRSAKKNSLDAAEAAAKVMASANIVNTLTHQIGAA